MYETSAESRENQGAVLPGSAQTQSGGYLFWRGYRHFTWEFGVQRKNALSAGVADGVCWGRLGVRPQQSI